MKREKTIARVVTDEMRSIIEAEMGDKLLRTTGDPEKDRYALRRSDLEEIILGLAMRLTEKEILHIVNDNRREAGLEAVSVSIAYYRKKYQDIIDEVYANATLRIGEIYRYSDKMIRISKYNDLAEALQQRVQSRLENPAADMEETLKMTNTFIRVLDRLNIEMGSPTLGKLALTRNRPWEKPEEEKPVPVNLTKEEMKELTRESIKERYKNQLPAVVSEKLSFTDYELCAFGEKLGDCHVCWSSKMTKGDAGSQCVVQKGEVKRCPHFFNRTMVDNRPWLENMREHSSFKQIAYAAGCTEYDDEVDDRLKYFFKKNGLPLKKPSSEPSND